MIFFNAKTLPRHRSKPIVKLVMLPTSTDSKIQLDKLTFSFFPLQGGQLWRIRHSQKCSRHSTAPCRSHEPRLLGRARGIQARTIPLWGPEIGPQARTLHAVWSWPEDVSRRPLGWERIFPFLRLTSSRFWPQKSGGRASSRIERRRGRHGDADRFWSRLYGSSRSGPDIGIKFGQKIKDIFSGKTFPVFWQKDKPNAASDPRDGLVEAIEVIQ